MINFTKRVLGEGFVQKIFFSQRVLQKLEDTPYNFTKINMQASMHDNFFLLYTRRLVCMQVKLYVLLIYARINIIILEI